jgi:hypothetical protein
LDINEENPFEIEDKLKGLSELKTAIIISKGITAIIIRQLLLLYNKGITAIIIIIRC